MDANVEDVKSNPNINHLKSVESPKALVNGDVDDESQSLLHTKKGGIKSINSQKSDRRKVQWLDKHGHKLAEILEFQPSDESDSDDEELYSCMCRVI